MQSRKIFNSWLRSCEAEFCPEEIGIRQKLINNDNKTMSFFMA
jgi:hypothetical protein